MGAAGVYFGGPDRPPRALRDLLEERVDAVPAGGSIDWVTYYFRDQRLAETLIRAHRRGVAVRISVEGNARTRSANQAVIGMLGNGIGDGLRVERRLFGRSKLHTKLYCFSDPRPHALVGSFNPSGNEPEDPAVIAEIGDQDRGHNLLVEIGDPLVVEALVARARAIHAGNNPFGSLALASHSTAAGTDFDAFFFPRHARNPLDLRLARLGGDAKLRIAASHFNDVRAARQLARLVERGGIVEVLTHHTLRRSPSDVVGYLRQAGVRTFRYEHPQGLPMHCKFILAEDALGRWCAFGSYNLNRNSRWFNQELLVFSDDPELWQTLDRRWGLITSEPWCTE